MSAQDERTWALWAHLSALSGFVVPLGSVLGPFIVLVAKRDQSAVVAAAAREALNFNLTVLLAALVCGVLFLILIGPFLLGALMIFWMVMVILAAIRTSEGISFRYPFTLRFLR